MKMKLIFQLVFVVLVISFMSISTVRSEIQITKENEISNNDRSLISKMIERGKIIMKAIPKTGLKLAEKAWNFIPSPETIFKAGKQTLIGLPQELIAYTVNSFCEYLYFVLFLAK